MESNGRYVRAPKYFDPLTSDDEREQDDSENDSDSRSGRGSCSGIASDSVLPTADPTLQDQGNESNYIHTTNKETNTVSVEPGSSKTPSVTNEWTQRVENVLSHITRALDSMQTMRPIPNTDPDWCTPVAVTPVNDSIDITLPSIRWDNIKPFPPGVPANKMWEEWNRYSENFEIAASLSNANDPVRRSQLLFLSIGDELQSIVRAAKLMPSLNDANCYRVFVDNIRNHFQSMTDSAAEHEAFSNMRQEISESAMVFHARLTAKVRLCGYSPTDQDRFVKAQLLKGLRNRELVKAARTYGHDTNYIVQAATRDEAYVAEISDQPATHGTEPYAINRVHRQTSQRPSEREPFGKRSRSESLVDRSQSNRFRSNQQETRRDLQDRGRRTRCRRCNGLPHRKFPCPALNRNCSSCGERGHYAAACRKSRVRQLQIKPSGSPPRDNDDDQVPNN